MLWPTNCVRQREPLADHTSFRIGGPAEHFAEPSTLEELIGVLREARSRRLPVCVVGGGTNTLAPDRGICGLVVHLGRGFRTIQDVSESDSPMVRVRCGAALLTQRLVYLAAKHGWGELEALAGLPGWVGGAVSMNAQEIGRFVQEVHLVRFDGTQRLLMREQLAFSYRDAALEPGIISHVVLQFPKVAPEEAYERIRRALQYRNSSQEVRLPSAGCAFKNPPGVPAGRLIDQLGLKGARIGDAQISQRHANFIVNVGHATCDDVLSLMEYVQHRVREASGVCLEPELRMIGQRWTA
ncbi:MAG: UDP-N-acetylmuramate dehydrogenase [Candidatus Omnitrophica bacterium]|nr:UDP-N-acetylmuramate dehydrogenase [Candidatus Omnitrophota bacterium]